MNWYPAGILLPNDREIVNLITIQGDHIRGYYWEKKRGFFSEDNKVLWGVSWWSSLEEESHGSE